MHLPAILGREGLIALHLSQLLPYFFLCWCWLYLSVTTLPTTSALHYCCACGNLVLSIRLFSCWVVPVFLTWKLLNHLRLCCLPFDVLSVICRLHNLLSPFKIPFYLVPPIVFSLRAYALFYLGTICRFSWNGTFVSHWRFHDNRHMNTSADEPMEIKKSKYEHLQT
jgi:hypothetical protein